jgi:hypothetical protein
VSAQTQALLLRAPGTAAAFSEGSKAAFVNLLSCSVTSAEKAVRVPSADDVSFSAQIRRTLVTECGSSVMLRKAISVLRSYVPSVIGVRAELRTTTTLFVNLVGVPQDHPNISRILGFATTEGVAASEGGGCLRQALIDDKGAVVILLFGLPTSSGQQHVHAAGHGDVRAAVRLATRLRREGIRCSLGLASGRTFCGDVGSPFRKELAVVGASVNLAARLGKISFRCCCPLSFSPSIVAFSRQGSLCDCECRQTR